MSAYVIFDVTDVTDMAAVEEYRKRVPAVGAKYGGKYLTRGGKTETLEGDWSPKRLVIVEFPSIEKAHEWYDSPEYAPLKALRQQHSRNNIIIAEGL